MINGVTKLIMMKSDVLDGFETVKACIAYKVNGEETTEFPFEINEGIEPVYVEMPGWNVDMTKMQSEDEFPEEFNAYISFLKKSWKFRSRLYLSVLTVNKQLSDIPKNKT